MTVQERVEAAREVARGVTKQFGRDYYLKKTRNGQPPDEMWQAMADQGLLALGVPESLGGGGGGVECVAAVMETMSRAGTPPLMYSLTTFSREAILRHGSESQIRDHVLPTMSGQRRFCFGVTEPDAGTNTFALRTRAKRTSDGDWAITGQKIFISGADEADHMLLAARTAEVGDDVSGSRDVISLFIVPMDTDGIELKQLDIDWRAPERQFSVFLDEAVVADDALVGTEGQGMRHLFSSLNAERIVISAWALGLGDYVLERAVEYARDRAPFGRPIGSYQAVQHGLARAKAQLEAARTMTYDAARRYDAGEDVGPSANMAKLLASEAADMAVDVAIQTHGGYGFSDEYDVVTMWPMIRILRVAPLNNEMILNYIGERILRLPRSY